MIDTSRRSIGDVLVQMTDKGRSKGVVHTYKGWTKAEVGELYTRTQDRQRQK